jgi:hypothetical protein
VLSQGPTARALCQGPLSVLGQGPLTVVQQAVWELRERGAQPHSQAAGVEAAVHQAGWALQQLAGHDALRRWNEKEIH